MKLLMAAVTILVSGAPAFAQAPNPQAIADIEALGGRVYPDQDGRIESVAMTGNRVTDAHLPLLLAFPDLRTLYLDDSQVTDAGLEHLYKLPNLQEVQLRGTRVTPAAALEFKDRHPGVYHVVVSPGFRPGRLAFAAAMLLPLAWGVWLIGMTIHKKPFLTQRIYARGLLWGTILAVSSAIFMLVAIIQAFGVDFHLADLFG